MQTKFKKIGNSFGVILNKKLLNEAGISNATDITIEAGAMLFSFLPLQKGGH